MPKANSKKKPLIKKPPPFPWLGDLFDESGQADSKPMFGCRAYYIGGFNVAVLADQSEEPWNGFLLPTFREHHAALQKTWPALQSHPILGKWLYISQSHPDFETITEELVRAALRKDPRIGIETGKKKKPRVPQKKTLTKRKPSSSLKK